MTAPLKSDFYICSDAQHELLRQSPAFFLLPFVGFMDDGEGGLLELRNCGCGSTIAIEWKDIDR